MARLLKMKAGAKITSSVPLYEGYEVRDKHIIANVGVDKIQDVLCHFIAMHDEPLFFFLELPANAACETEVSPGFVEKFHKDVYYLDGCSRAEAMTVLFRAGELLCNDGISSFGFGCHESGDEIMFGKYNVLTLCSEDIEKYGDFFTAHEIEKTESLTTAWDTLTERTPGICGRYEAGGKTVFDIPGMFKEWGMYLVEQRED